MMPPAAVTSAGTAGTQERPDREDEPDERVQRDAPPPRSLVGAIGAHRPATFSTCITRMTRSALSPGAWGSASP